MGRDIDTMTDDEIAEELEARIGERIAAVSEAAQLVYAFAKTATTAEFRALIRRSGGLGIAWTLRDGEVAAVVQYVDQETHKRCLGLK